MTTELWDDAVRDHPGVRLASVERVGESGDVWVNVPGHGVLQALILESIEPDALYRAAESGERIVVLMEGEDARQPIVLGVVGERLPPQRDPVKEVDARVDGRRVILTGQEEVTLRCGKASITLTKAGKILLRGAYLLSRSSGVNRIKGGSVQIN